MCSQLLSILAETRPAEAWPVMQEIADAFMQISETVESDWLKVPFSRVVDENELGEMQFSCVERTIFTVLQNHAHGR